MQLIAAADKKWGIGKNGGLLFSIPTDMKFFRNQTMGKTVIMGRSTLESFPGGKPLPKRRNIVITRNPDYKCDGAEVVHSIEEAAKIAEADAFVIGGAEIYAQMLSMCDTAYITKVDADGGADKFFPNLDTDGHWEIKETKIENDGEYTLTFCRYEKIKPY